MLHSNTKEEENGNMQYRRFIVLSLHSQIHVNAEPGLATAHAWWASVCNRRKTLLLEQWTSVIVLLVADFLGALY